jgi:hypothetical protein
MDGPPFRVSGFLTCKFKFELSGGKRGRAHALRSSFRQRA